MFQTLIIAIVVLIGFLILLWGVSNLLSKAGLGMFPDVAKGFGDVSLGVQESFGEASLGLQEKIGGGFIGFTLDVQEKIGGGFLGMVDDVKRSLLGQKRRYTYKEKIEQVEVIMPTGEVIKTDVTLVKRGDTTPQEWEAYRLREQHRVQQLIDQDRRRMSIQEKRDAGLIDVGFMVDGVREGGGIDAVTGYPMPTGKT